MENKIITSKPKTKPRIMLYAKQGVGKSTLLSKFPKPIIINADDSLTTIEVAQTPVIKYWNNTKGEQEKAESLLYWLEWLYTTAHDYKTVGIDCIDNLEGLGAAIIIHEHGGKDINDDKIKALNYGKGSKLLGQKIQKDILNMLTKLSREKDMYVVLLCHERYRQVETPIDPSYEKSTFKLENAVAEYIKEWADVIGLLKYDFFVDADGKPGKPVRVILTNAHPAHEGKNRYDLPEKIPADNFIQVITKGDK